MSIEVYYKMLPKEIQRSVSIEEIKSYIFGNTTIPPELQAFVDSKIPGYSVGLHFIHLAKLAVEHECQREEDLEDVLKDMRGQIYKGIERMEKNPLAYFAYIYQFPHQKN